MGSGIYSNELYVRHKNGKFYEYYINANPVGSDGVLFMRREIEIKENHTHTHSPDVLFSDGCIDGVNVNHKNKEIGWDGKEL